jgi:AcrR family transcriptional regulator
MARRSDTRERLIEAAVEVIDERGVNRLRLREVAERVGIAEPSIYKFFTNRDALVIAASVVRYERGLLDLSVAFVRLVDEARSLDDLRAAVRTIMRAAFAEERARVRSTRLNVLGMAQTRPELAAELLVAQREASALLGRGLARAAAMGWIRADVDPAALAFWAYTVINGRVIVELDPERSGAETWDELSIEAVLATFEGRAALG